MIARQWEFDVGLHNLFLTFSETFSLKSKLECC